MHISRLQYSIILHSNRQQLSLPSLFNLPSYSQALPPVQWALYRRPDKYAKMSLIYFHILIAIFIEFTCKASILENISSSVGERSKCLVIIFADRFRLENIFDLLLDITCQFRENIQCFDSVPQLFRATCSGYSWRYVRVRDHPSHSQLSHCTIKLFCQITKFI